jgi:K+-sensing histidine kinase KdpD
MWVVKRALPLAASLAVVSAVTAALWLVKVTALGPHHLVFFYLLPTAFVAVLFGSFPAMLGAVAATFCAAYFLYDPIYSFQVASTREVGELICFAGLALIGAKCTADFLRPDSNFSPPDAATEGPESGA